MRTTLLAPFALATLLAAAPALAQDPPVDKPAADKPAADKPAADKPAADKPAEKPAASSSTLSQAASATLKSIGTLIEQSPREPPPGNEVAGPLFSEDRTPPYDPDNANALRFAAHGYFRAPLRLGLKKRTDAKPDEAGTNIRTPWLVDDDYFRSGFLYTRLQESDWTELYLMAGNQYLTGTVAIEGTLFSDWAKPIIDKQLGLTKGWLTFNHGFDLGKNVRLRLKIKGGAFSDRFGWQERYDTYLFGRTHQLGEQIRVDLDVGKFTFSLLDGFGAHLESIESNQGFTLLHYLRAAASYDKTAELAFYYMRTWTQDQRQLKEIADGSLRVIGVEARADTHGFGRAVIGVSSVKADQSMWLAPSLELMHSSGGGGLTDNYFGRESSNNGTGSLLNIGFQYDFSTSEFIKRVAGTRPLGEADINLGFFGMFTRVGSDQVDPDWAKNRDGIQKFKWGAELGVWPLSFLGASVRYDRVVADMHDDPSAFRAISPRITVRTHWLADAQIFAQYSHYWYGSRMKLRTGQIPLETDPDSDVFKIQAQLSF